MSIMAAGVQTRTGALPPSFPRSCHASSACPPEPCCSASACCPPPSRGRRFGVGFGTIANIMILLFVVNTVLSVVSNFTNGPSDGPGGGRKDSFDDEDW